MTPALIVYLVVLGVASVCAAVGIWLLFGPGWTLLAVAGCLLGFSEIVRRGMTNG